MKKIIKTASLVLFAMLASNVDAQTKKQLGKEYPPADEAQTILDLKKGIAATTKTPLGPNGQAIRTAHTWSHGLVKAKFVVEPDLPKNLAEGVFQSGASYDALVRFSNSTPSAPKPADATPDARGMAIKLLNVPGKKLLKDDPENNMVQDFVTMSHPTFNSTSAAEFTKFIVTVGNPDKVVVGAYFADPANKPFFGRVAEANIVVQNVLTIPYFSTTPYRLGKSQKVAVKYKIQPTATNLPNQSVTDPDYLRKNLVYNLSQGDVSFDFMVQFQQDADKQPIENPTIEWKTPFVKVATIIIPKQVFDTPENNTKAENMTFNPWHSLPAHQPLGGINRARKTVYEAMQKIRHQQNGVK